MNIRSLLGVKGSRHPDKTDMKLPRSTAEILTFASIPCTISPNYLNTWWNSPKMSKVQTHFLINCLRSRTLSPIFPRSTAETSLSGKMFLVPYASYMSDGHDKAIKDEPSKGNTVRWEDLCEWFESWPLEELSCLTKSPKLRLIYPKRDN